MTCTVSWTKNDKKFYTPVIKHSNGKSPFSIGNTSSKGSFSIAMLDYQRVKFHIGQATKVMMRRTNVL